MSWEALSGWWREEVREDPAYAAVITPLLLELLPIEPGVRYLDLGCGEGRVIRHLTSLGAEVHGMDLNEDLARSAGSAFVARLPGVPVRDDSYRVAYSVLTLEHVEDHAGFFRESRRVVASDGTLVIVINHPVWTAPDSTPITDDDGEVLWRPGDYFSAGRSEVPAGDGAVTFFHRSIGDLLNAAAEEGWSLERVVERPHHDLPAQGGIPRLLACRWRKA